MEDVPTSATGAKIMLNELKAESKAMAEETNCEEGNNSEGSPQDEEDDDMIEEEEEKHEPSA